MKPSKNLISSKMSFALIFLFFTLSVCIGHGQGGTIDHGQGEMAGEATTTSAILQSRLTTSCEGSSNPDCALQGIQGVARFEISIYDDFRDSFMTEWIEALAENDFIIKKKVSGLSPGTRYYYRLLFGQDINAIDLTVFAADFGRTNCDTAPVCEGDVDNDNDADGSDLAVLAAATFETGPTCTFRTLDLENAEREVNFVVVTGMNYYKFHTAPESPDKDLGYPALETMLNMNPDFIVFTGDNVYYDSFPTPATTQASMREVWHMQFIQPRFVSLFSRIQAYWEKDDHDHRYNNSGPTGFRPPSNQLGINTFLEQVPVVDPEAPEPITYRTIRINKLLQIWLTEGRDYRSPNRMADGENKTLWGETQRAWLKQTLLESDATFKLLISPTPMVGPDLISLPGTLGLLPKRDNHTNIGGFRYEGEAFFTWLNANSFIDKNFYIITGDRHWKYHSIRADGFEEFSCGALVDANSRLGIDPGDPDSTDPDGLIDQPFTDLVPSGGLLKVTVNPGNPATCTFTFYDENGVELYSVLRNASS